MTRTGFNLKTSASSGRSSGRTSLFAVDLILTLLRNKTRRLGYEDILLGRGLPRSGTARRMRQVFDSLKRKQLLQWFRVRNPLGYGASKKIYFIDPAAFIDAEATPSAAKEPR